jgi:hypothetical protein
VQNVKMSRREKDGHQPTQKGPGSAGCWRLNNVSSYDPQAHGSVVAIPLEYSPMVNQSVEQVDCYAQLSTNIVDLKLFMKYV